MPYLGNVPSSFNVDTNNINNGAVTSPKLSSGLNIDLDSGSAATPSLTFDANTGLYSPGEDQLAISTNGSGRLFVDASGRVGVGTASPTALLHVLGDAKFGTEDANAVGIEVGNGATGNRSARIDFVGDTTYTDYGLRVIRASGGANGNSQINHRGTGSLILNAEDAGSITLNANGSERLRVTSAGLVGIGTNSPGKLLHVNGDARFGAADANTCGIELGEGATGDRSAYIDLTGDTTYTDYGLRIVRGATGANTTSAIQHRGTGELRLVTQDAAPLTFLTSNTERARIDSSGRLLVGTSSVVNAFATTFQVQVLGSSLGTSGQLLAGFADDATSSGALTLGKSRNTTKAAGTVVQSGDRLGFIGFVGDDGTALIRGAQILAEVDGTPGANDMPGRLVFSTTADGAALPTERMRIDSSGRVGIGTTSPSTTLHVNSASGARVRAGGAVGSGFEFNDANTRLDIPAANNIAAYTSNVERARIDSSGRLLVGTSTAVASSTGVLGALQHQSSDTGTAANANFGRWTNDASGYAFYFAKSRGTSVGTQGLVSDGDFLGALFFEGSDGTQLRRGAAITANVDGTPGANDMPGRLTFSTTADGASSPTERMRIDSSGRVGIGTTSLSGYGLRIARTTDAATFIANGLGLTADATASTAVYGNYTSIGTASNSGTPYTVPSIQHFRADQGTINVDSTITAQYGFISGGNLTAATNNYGFFGNLATGTGRWNFYAAGTADSYFASNNFIFANGGTERARMDSSGRLLVGTSTDRFSTKLLVEGTDGTGGATFARNSNDAGPPYSLFIKSRGTNVGSNTVVQSGDTLGFIGFYGTDGTSPISGASIQAQVDATPGTNDMPGRLVFSTTADGASSPTERLRIANDGSISSVIPGGSTLYPRFGCRAWVNFNGTSTVSIRANGNVSSITDNGTGDYTVNFTTAMADANYSAVGSAGRGASGGNGGRQVTTNCLTNPTTSACRINSTDGGGVVQDLEFISVSIFR